MKILTIFLFLFFICSITSIAQQKELIKQQSIDYIKSYYSNLKTGSYEVAGKGEVKKYSQYTGNYKVSIKGCKFKISYDEISWPDDCTVTVDYEVYNWNNSKKKNRKTIEFDGNEIDSISNGNRELGESGVVNWNIRFYSAKGIKITTVPEIKDQFSGKAKYLVDLKINDESKEGKDFSNFEIVNAFQRLVAFCKTQ